MRLYSPDREEEECEAAWGRREREKENGQVIR